MLKPLEQWICDYCNEIINSMEEGYVEWIREYDKEREISETYGFKIVHHKLFSPIKENGGCYHYTGVRGRSDQHLRDFIGSKGMQYLLSFLDVGPYHNPEFRGPGVRNIREYVEFVRRLTFPYYEEARLYWDRALADGYFNSENEISIYLPDNLRKLIEQYSED